MLQNPFYMGYLRYRGAFSAGKAYRGKGEMVKGIHQPIVSEELFAACQKVRTSRRRSFETRQSPRRVYMLGGLLVCKTCGKKMRGQSAQAGRYYRDAARFAGVGCAFSGMSVRADAVEAQVSRVMESLVLPEDWQEALQAQLEAIEQITPHEVRQAAARLAGLQEAWKAATPDERKELCQSLLKELVFDFVQRKVVSIRPRSEYVVLFQMLPSLQSVGDGAFQLREGG